MENGAVGDGADDGKNKERSMTMLPKNWWITKRWHGPWRKRGRGH